ncbi:hypothetical protein PMIN07_001486 [Paraphaeosphaeria minitans]
MPPTNFSTLARRYSSYNCTDYLYMQDCEPHRIIVGAIFAIVIFLVIVVIALLCIRHRKHKTRNQALAQAQRQTPQLRKQAVFAMYEAEPELQVPPPAYARVDPESGVRRGA